MAVPSRCNSRARKMSSELVNDPIATQEWRQMQPIFRSTSASVFPSRAGDGDTVMPANSIAAIFELGVALAAGDDRAGVAHAAAGRRGPAGDEADHRLLAAALGLVLEELRGVLLRRAADLADHDDRVGRLVVEKQLEHVDEIHALHRIAADAERGRLAEAFARGLEHRLVGERAGARHDADLARLEDVAGHDADLALARR